MGSIQVIDEAGKRLKKLVKQLLYLTGLDYLTSRDKAGGKIELHRLVEGITQRLNVQRTDITCRLNLQPVSWKGTRKH